jgi:hypothetical protein
MFKPGDRVKCIDSSNTSGLIEGSIYTVKEIVKAKPGWYCDEIKLILNTPYDEYFSWRVDRFVKVDNSRYLEILI